MRGKGYLCHKSGGNELCYKHGGSALVYKSAPGKKTVVTFAWGGDGKDLDICAYWDGAPSMAVGYGHNASAGSHATAPFEIAYSGDVTSTGGTEWAEVVMNPWSGSGTRTFRVHFNFFGYDPGSYPASTCDVIASQVDGPTFTKTGQGAGTASGKAATTGDPSCVLTFNSSGTLISLE